MRLVLPTRSNMTTPEPNPPISQKKKKKTVIQELGWEVLPLSPYSPELTLSDIRLFYSLLNALRGVIFDSAQVY